MSAKGSVSSAKPLQAVPLFAVLERKLKIKWGWEVRHFSFLEMVRLAHGDEVC